ncbi:MAG: hypothetical protein IJK97_11600, partial [Thermoguttaceae bacterium]|nr:hypothetical protein [Thermoguttaceae bacterium]
YYDRPYNYRHYSEYPWNAEITEPRPYPNRANQVGSEVIIQSVPTPVESITPAETTSPAQSIMGPVTTPVEEVEPSSNMIPEQIDEVIEESIPTTKSSDPLLEDLL